MWKKKKSLTMLSNIHAGVKPLEVLTFNEIVDIHSSNTLPTKFICGFTQKNIFFSMFCFLIHAIFL